MKTVTVITKRMDRVYNFQKQKEERKQGKQSK